MALGEVDTPAAGEALEALCRAYWYPVYAYIRRRGHSPHQAEDLTQGFFESFLAKDHWIRADPKKGRLRSYMLGAINHFLSDADDREHRLKRGGRCPVISLDLRDGEGRYLAEPANSLTPERLFERRWVLALLDEVLQAIEAEYRARGQERLFRRIAPYLVGKDSFDSYARAAAELDLSEVALRSAVHRLRRRYGELFKHQIANTLADVDDLEAEVQHLAAVLSCS